MGASDGQLSSEIGGTAPPPAPAPALAEADVDADELADEEADDGGSGADPPPYELSQASPSPSASRPLESVGSSSRVSWACSSLAKSEQSRSPPDGIGVGSVSGAASTMHPGVPSPMPLPRSASLHFYTTALSGA